MRTSQASSPGSGAGAEIEELRKRIEEFEGVVIKLHEVGTMISKKKKGNVEVEEESKELRIEDLSGFVKRDEFDLLEKQTAYNTGEINRIKERMNQLEQSVLSKVNNDEYSKLLSLVSQLRASSMYRRQCDL